MFNFYEPDAQDIETMKVMYQQPEHTIELRPGNPILTPCWNGAHMMPMVSDGLVENPSIFIYRLTPKGITFVEALEAEKGK